MIAIVDTIFAPREQHTIGAFPELTRRLGPDAYVCGGMPT